MSYRMALHKAMLKTAPVRDQFYPDGLKTIDHIKCGSVYLTKEVARTAPRVAPIVGDVEVPKPKGFKVRKSKHYVSVERRIENNRLVSQMRQEAQAIECVEMTAAMRNEREGVKLASSELRMPDPHTYDADTVKRAAEEAKAAGEAAIAAVRAETARLRAIALARRAMIEA